MSLKEFIINAMHMLCLSKNLLLMLCHAMSLKNPIKVHNLYLKGELDYQNVDIRARDHRIPKCIHAYIYKTGKI